MMESFAAVVSFFLTGPLQAELSEKLQMARAPQEIVSSLMDCSKEAAPAIVDRVLSDPFWALTQTFNVWTGQKQPEAVLLEAAPACAGAIDAARPFLVEGESSA